VGDDVAADHGPDERAALAAGRPGDPPASAAGRPGAAAHPAGRPVAARLGLAVLLAAAVTAALVAVGRVHHPDYSASFFGEVGVGALALKSWLATVVLGLAGVQVLLALWLYSKLPFASAPGRWVGAAHRLTGIALVAVTIPVAMHCLIAYGVRLSPLRVAVHSLAGCFLYGAYAAKVLLVRSRRLPPWVLPVAGGTLVTLVIVLWYTAALWYFHGFQLPHV
jgi:Family of unknown function (DUF6529)